MSWIYTCLVFSVGLVASGGELVLDSVSVQRGSEVITAVRLSDGGSRVAALQFDLEYNSDLPVVGFASQIADGAGKTLYSATIEPGRTRFLLVGVNGITLSDGAAVQVSVTVDSSALPGRYPLQLRNALASDPVGFAVPLTSVDGSVTVIDSVANLTPSGMFAHVASGEGWKTSFTLMNLAETESPARLVFWDDGGYPLPLPFGFPSNPKRSSTIGASVDVTIPTNGVVVVEAGSPGQFPVRMGWAQLQAPAGVVGWATLGQQFDTGYAIEAVVPMETRPASNMILTFDNSNGFSTGVAMANPSDTASADILIIFRDADGQQLFTNTQLLSVRGHHAFSLAERYPDLGGRTGSMEFRNPTGGAIAVLGLRFSQRGSITSIPPVSK